MYTRTAFFVRPCKMYIIIIVFLASFFYYVCQGYKLRKQPPYLEGSWPIIGHSIMLLRIRNYYNYYSTTFNKMLERKIDIFTFRVGKWKAYGTLNPEDSYLVANSLTKENTFYKFMKPFLGEGLITADVPKWKIHRKLINPTFNQLVLDGYLYEFNNQARQLVDTLSKEADMGPFDHLKYLKRSILKTLCATAMGASIDEEDEITRELFMTGLQEFSFLLTERATKFWLHLDAVNYLTGHKKQQDAVANKMKKLTEVIFKKKKQEFLRNKSNTSDITGKRFKSFIDLLLELSEDDEFDSQAISDELNTFIGAGADTISVTLSNILTCVGTNKEVQDRIIEELREVFLNTDRDVEKQDLSKLKYLEAVIKETLRLYPPVPFIGRILEKDTEIQGYTLPAGSKCYIGIYGVLRHWTWGPDAGTFRPERWLDGSLPANLKGLATFGVGKRSCIGSNFTIIGVKTFLATLLRRYSVASDVTRMKQELSIVAKPISGHEISILKRQNLSL